MANLHTGKHPDFLIIGAARCGTTSLYNSLASHPEIFMPSVKEPSFYAFDNIKPQYKSIYGDDKYTKSQFYLLDRYLGLFPPKKAGVVQGEASTIYLYSEKAAEVIWKYNENVKLIVVLRDPFERAYSAYNYNRMELLEDVPFEEALRIESKRIKEGWSPEYHYINKGLYYQQLIRYFKRFGEHRIRVFILDDLKSSYVAVLSEICTFLGIENTYKFTNIERKNVSGLPRSFFQRQLRQFFAKPNYLRSIGKHLLPLILRRRVAENLLYGKNTKGLEKFKPIDASLKAQVFNHYKDDLNLLEVLIDRDLSSWRVNAQS